MRIAEGKCVNCKGNIVVDLEARTMVCEDCGLRDRIRTKKEAQFVAYNSAEWGPKEQRQRLTLAAQYLIEAFQNDEVPQNMEIRDAIEAYRGLITDKEKLEYLEKGGFIIRDENVDK